MGCNFARTGIPLPVSTTAYNAANELTQWGTAALRYDANGNMLSSGSDGYTWDARNHLASTLSGASFTYDPFGRRVAKTISGATTSYLYDGLNPVQELSGTTVTANLMAGLTVDEFFTRTDSAGARNFLTDPLDSTVALADSTGAVRTSYTYEPFGSTAVSGVGSANPYQYTGRENDSTGLYFYRARYYSPMLGRFVSQDPIGFAGGTSLYAYVGNAPTEFIDPLGLYSWDEFLSDAGNFSAGAADNLTFGLTNYVRNKMGTNSAVNRCGGWYTAGTAAGIGLSTAIGGAAGAEAAEANAGRKGYEFSHWIPDRLGGPRSLWNGNWTSTAEHAVNDPFRYRFMPAAWKTANPMNSPWVQQWNRIPLLLKGGAAGAAYGGASAMAGRSCGCQ